MRKKIIICLYFIPAICMLLLLSPITVFAEEATEDTIVEVDAGVTPGSFFYWLDTIFERVSIWLQQGAEEEIPRLLELADEKIAEVEELAETDPAAAAEAAERYEKYITEAVEKAEKAQETEDVDNLLQEISDASMTHIAAFVEVGSKAAALEQPYIEESLEVIQEQEKNVLELIQDEEKRAQTIEDVLSFLQEQEEKIPPEIRENIRTTLETLISEISQFVIEKGGALYDSLSESAIEYARDQANQQIDKAKESIIETIEGIEL